MSIQYKHVSVNLAAHQSAKFISGLTGLSNEATVALFRTLVLNERISPNTPIGKELIKADIVGPFGHLKPWLASHLSETIVLLLETAGCDLLPQAEPTDIQSLGHRLVKGKADVSKQVRAADRDMSKVAFTVDHRVLALATCDQELSKEDRMALAVLLNEDLLADTFYFPVSYDYRGRMYYRGGIITPQGSDFMKGVLMFSEKAPIGEHGRFAITQALADAAGFKGTKAEAMAWASTADLTALANGSEGYQAAGLACELVALNHFEGNDEDFESGVICHMDATCSGLQHAAAITGHRPTAELTNCTARSAKAGKADIYQTVANDWAEQTSTQLGKHAAVYGRNMAKKAVMLSGYGAGKAKLIEEIDLFLQSVGIKMDWNEREETLLMSVLEHRCVAALAVKHAVARAVKAAGNEGVSWTTHDGFTVYQSKMEGETVQLGTFAMEFDAGWTEEANITSVSPNFVHSLDAAQMREAVRLMRGSPVAAIHDSLGVRAGDYVVAAKAVRVAFTKLQGKEILESMGTVCDVTGDYNTAECYDSSYFWC